MAPQVTIMSWNEAVKRQFPWVQVARLTERAKVSKVSPELLEVVPSESYGTNASGYSTGDQVRFHDAGGKVLGEVSPAMSHSDANDMSSDQDGETIGDGWARLPNPQAVRFVTRFQSYRGGVLSHTPDSDELEIFKVGDFYIDEWLEARRRASDAAVWAADGERP